MYANNELKIVVLICKVIRLLLIIRLYLDIINEYYQANYKVKLFFAER